MAHRVDAPAKLTLRLKVVGRRYDGYHLIEADIVALSLTDTVEIGRTDSGTRVQMFGDPPVGEATRYCVPVDSSNSVVRALDFLGVDADVEVRKRIPFGAGLGGGSSDAAALLRAFGYCGDPSAAIALGADVPASLVGGHVRVGGIGDLVTPLVEHAGTYVLFVPNFSISTAAVYQAFDHLGSDGGENDLYRAACSVEPRLSGLAGELTRRFGYPMRLAGSGSTLFVEATLEDLDVEPQHLDGHIAVGTLESTVGPVVVIECHSIPRSVSGDGRQ